MNENLRFLLNIFGITSILLLISLLPVRYFGSSQLAWGVFYGYLVSLINILFAFFSIKWAFNKSTKTFFAVVLGGMGVRFAVLITALFLVWKFIQVPLLSFIVSLVCFYLTLQFFEVRFIQKELNSNKAA
ncbi:hypothetical protein MJD09_11060 [bacterium]|nr:hypothetical protein [bacterium]